MFFLPKLLAASVLTISGDPSSTMTVNSATAGQQPDQVTDATTTYTLVADTENELITGQVNSVTAGTVLYITLQAPTGGTSQGTVSLDTSAKNLVTGIPSGDYTGSQFTITYDFGATADVAPFSPTVKVVTFTLTTP